MANTWEVKPISFKICINITIFYLVHIASSSWIRTDSVLPRAGGSSAIGYNPYNETIYLLGESTSKQQIEYDIDGQFITDHGTKSLPINVFSFTQYYAQVNDIIYIKTDAIEAALSTFNVNTGAFIQSYTTNMNIPSTSRLIYPCVAATERYVIVSGGRYFATLSSTNKVHSYDLKTDQWIQNVSPMTHKRDQHSCIIHPFTNELYVFGGFSSDAQCLSSIGKINIDDITQKSWTFVGDLTQALCTTAAVYYRNMIFIIGGWHCSANFPRAIVHTLDVLTDTIAVFKDPLPVVLSEGSAIVVGDMLYVFAGESNDGYDDALLTYDLYSLNLPTLTTTANPSTKPTTNPSTIPTVNPIERPTAIPTAKPTTNPSTKPTVNPIERPTAIPTAKTTITTSNPSASGTPTPFMLSTTAYPITASLSETTAITASTTSNVATSSVISTLLSTQLTFRIIHTGTNTTGSSQSDVLVIMIVASIVLCLIVCVMVAVVMYCNEKVKQANMVVNVKVLGSGANTKKGLDTHQMVHDPPNFVHTNDGNVDNIVKAEESGNDEGPRVTIEGGNDGNVDNTVKVEEGENDDGKQITMGWNRVKTIESMLNPNIGDDDFIVDENDCVY
eukprot:716980_1